MGSFEFSQNALKGSAQPQNGTYVGQLTIIILLCCSN